jgi:hypothetical protein
LSQPPAATGYDNFFHRLNKPSGVVMAAIEFLPILVPFPA